MYKDKDMEIDFMKRTLKLVCGYNGNYEVTFLINCCLGLLVLPREKYYESVPREEIPPTGSLWGLSRDSVTVDREHCGYKLSNVIRKIRNGLCHFHIKMFPDDNGEIGTIEIKDGNFKAALSIDEFRELAVSLAIHVTGKVTDEGKKLKS